MFVKRCAYTQNGKAYEQWWIVKSYRENKKVKHKYLLNISGLTHIQRENIKKALRNPNCRAIMECELTENDCKNCKNNKNNKNM